jgi:hypothetical protein
MIGMAITVIASMVSFSSPFFFFSFCCFFLAAVIGGMTVTGMVGWVRETATGAAMATAWWSARCESRRIF